MDREEFRAKLEVINDLAYKKDYKSALEHVESIEWKRVRDMHTLCVAGEVYAANKRYEESKEIFLLAYSRSPVRKNILYRLIEVSIKMDDLEEALKYYQQFLEAAPNDNTQYILKYKIYSAKDAPLEDQIQILEEYKEREYTERWSYELAKLYYKAGEEKKCIEACDDIVLWFSEGEYVMKSLELKQRLTSLTPRQKLVYENNLQPEEKAPENSGYREAPPLEQENEIENSEELEEKDEDDSAKKEDISEDMAPILDSNGVLQKKISKGIKDIFSGIMKEWEGEEDFLEGYSGTPKINIADVIPPQKVEESIKEKELAQEKESEEPDEKMDSEESEAEPVEMADPEENEEEPAEIDNQEELEKKPIEMTDWEESEAKPVETVNPEEGEEEPVETENREENKAEPVETANPKEPEEELVETENPEEEEPIKTVNSKEDGEELVEMANPEEDESKPIKMANSQKAEEEPEEAALPKGSETAPEEKKEIKKFDTSGLPKLELPNFNLEEVILSAAEKQGIGVPDIESAPSPPPDAEEEEIPEAGEETPEPEEESAEPPVVMEKIQPEGEIRPQEEILGEEESLIQFIESKDAREAEEPGVIVPRNKSLDEVETKIFSYFSIIPGMKEQLVETLADAQLAASDKTSRFGNVIVMGNSRTGKTRLTDGLIKTICRELHMPAARTATVEASQLNGRDIAKIVSKLSGGFLVIQKTNQLDAESVFQLNQAMEFRTDGLTVILEDEKIGMRKFIAKYQKFAKKFTSTINIPVFTNDELVHFAKIYADEMGYVMDTMGVLALYNLIGDNQKEDEPMTIGTVKDMMDAAITKAESSHRKLQRSISKKRFDNDGKVVLYEKDFK